MPVSTSDLTNLDASVNVVDPAPIAVVKEDLATPVQRTVIKACVKVGSHSDDASLWLFEAGINSAVLYITTGVAPDWPSIHER